LHPKYRKVTATHPDVLRDYFGQFGELAECRLVVDKHSNKSRGFGFVALKDMDASQVVLDQRHLIFGKEVECKAALSKQDSNQRVSDEKSKKIFVGGIPLYITEGDFKFIKMN
jgi:RNA recognition motif-containing protein